MTCIKKTLLASPLLFFLLLICAPQGLAKKKGSVHTETLSQISLSVFRGEFQKAHSQLEHFPVQAKSEDQNRVDFLKAYLHLKMNRPEEALVLLTRLEKHYPKLKNIFPLYIARAQRMTGKTPEAITTLQKYCGGPCTGETRVSQEYAILLRPPESQKKFSTEEKLTRARSFFTQERFSDAANEFFSLWNELDSFSQDAVRDEAAEVFFKARKYAEAAKHYEKLLEKEQNPEKQISLLEKLGSSYARSDQHDRAIETQKKLQIKLPVEAQWEPTYKIAYLLADAKRCSEATQALDYFLTTYPKNQKADDALWQKAWCEYKLGHWQNALKDFNTLETQFSSSPYLSRVAYWKYRVTKILGPAEQMQEAEKRWMTLGGKFYKQWEDKKHSATYCPVVKAEEPSRKNLSEIPKLNTLSEDQQASLKELLALGLWEDFFELYRSLKNDSTQMSLEEMAVWINYFAHQEGIPLALVRGLIEQESHFKPSALSPVGARGLMQIMPQTGLEVSRELDLESFHHKHLFDPIFNLRLGVHYLAKLLKKFSGNAVQAIAAYNAGPEAVDRWGSVPLKIPCDEFIEQIPYRETRHYVQQVLMNYWDGE